MLPTKIDQELQAIIACYKGFLRHEDFKKICEQVLELARQTGIKKIFVDTHQLKVMLQESQQWVNEVWFPEAIEIGISHMAFLVPEDIFGKMSMEATNRKILDEGHIDIRYFKDREQARAWLNSM